MHDYSTHKGVGNVIYVTYYVVSIDVPPSDDLLTLSGR
jgi:hypothetical protein